MLQTLTVLSSDALAKVLVSLGLNVTCTDDRLAAGMGIILPRSVKLQPAQLHNRPTSRGPQVPSRHCSVKLTCCMLSPDRMKLEVENAGVVWSKCNIYASHKVQPRFWVSRYTICLILMDHIMRQY